MPELFRADIAKIDLGKPVMHSQVGEVLVTGDSLVAKMRSKSRKKAIN